MTEAARDDFPRGAAAAPSPPSPPSAPESPRSPLRRYAPHGARPMTAVERLESLQWAQRLSRVGIWEFDYDTGLMTVSDELLELFGLERDGMGFSGSFLDRGVHPADLPAVAAATDRLLRFGESVTLRCRGVQQRDGLPTWLTVRGEAERDDLGRLRRALCTVTDISEFAHAEQELREAHAELLQAHGYQQAVIATVPDAIHVYDVAHRTYTRANRSGAPLAGFTPASVEVMSGESLDECLPLQDWAELSAAFTSTAQLADGEVVQVQHRVTEADGSTTWLSRRLSVFARDVMGFPSQLLVVTRDVTTVVEVNQLLEHAATHDELTGLPNRRHVQERLAKFAADSEDGAAAVLVVDLDGFKRINDTRGHAVGDVVLRGVARRLTELTRGNDIVARLGGDEFVVLMWAEHEKAATELAEAVASRIERALAEQFDRDGLDFGVTASIGISIVSSETAPQLVLAEADAAMYTVKRHGANGHAIFDGSIAEQQRRDEMIERCLARALRADEVEVHYQPIVEPSTGLVHSVEALVRIRDQDGELLDTACVIEVAERRGIISRLDDIVLRSACAQVATWRQSPTYADLRLTLNRSAQDILRPGFYDRIVDALAQTALPAAALTIEITETVLLDAEEGAMIDIRRLHERGIKLAIDDFGTGYASLSQLTKLPISAIKIDRSFTSNIMHDRTCSALVRATIGIAADLQLNCVVEGVETEEQLAALPRYRRVLVQGFLYGRPRRAEDGLGVSVARW